MQLPNVCTIENTENKDKAIVWRDAPKALTINVFLLAVFTYFSVTTGAWYNILFAVIFSIATIIWIVTIVHLHKLRIQERKEE